MKVCILLLTVLVYCTASFAADHGRPMPDANLDAILAGLARDMPAITKSAEAAAAVHVQEGCGIGVFGEEGMVSESVGRAGGIMRINYPHQIKDPKWKGVVLAFPIAGDLESDLAALAEYRKQGKHIVLFGPASYKDAAAKVGLEPNSLIDTHGLAGDSVANMTALWTWTGEFVAALTRLGKMPAMYQSYAVPGGMERGKKLGQLKYHEGEPQKVAAGVLGKQYLDALAAAMASIEKDEGEKIRKVADMALTAQAAGHKAYLSVSGHAIIHHVPADCGLEPIFKGWDTLRKNPPVVFAKGDFVLCVGYDSIFPELAKAARDAGATIAWSLTNYNQDPNLGVPAIGAGEILIDQKWAFGDAVATVPNYDVKILPASGVIAEAILRRICHEIKK